MIWWYLKINLPYDLVLLLLAIYPRVMKTCPHKDLHVNICNIIIHNQQNVEKLKSLSAGEWMNSLSTQWNNIY